MCGGSATIFFTDNVSTMHTWLVDAADFFLAIRYGTRPGFRVSVICAPHRRPDSRRNLLLVLPVVVDAREICAFLLTKPLHKVVVFGGKDDIFLYRCTLLFIKIRCVVYQHAFVITCLEKILIFGHEILV